MRIAPEYLSASREREVSEIGFFSECGPPRASTPPLI